MIVVDSVILGILSGMARGGTFRQLMTARLRYESPMLVVFIFQLSVPRLAQAGHWPSGLAVAVWVITMCLLVAVAALNWRSHGMIIVATGIALNALVISVNCGMPVSRSAVESVTGQDVAQNLFDTDLVHIPLESGTSLPVLADVIPVPGPAWHRGVVSVGDIFLALGAAWFVHTAMTAEVGVVEEIRPD